MDVKCDQLVEFLDQRGILRGSWKADLERLKNTWPEARLMIPDDWTRKLETQTTVAVQSYWRAREIFAVLLAKKEEEGAATKTWLGKYKDPLLYKWDLVLRAYRKNNLYLAESANLLFQNSNYEIPSLKKDLSLAESRVGFLNKKIADTTVQLSKHREEIEAFCHERGISGTVPTPKTILEDTLRMIRNKLPKLLDNVRNKVQDSTLRRAAEFYREFAKFLGFDSNLATSDDAQNIGDRTANTSLLHTFFTLANYDGPLVDTKELKNLHPELSQDESPQIHNDFDGGIEWGDLGDLDTKVDDGDADASGINWDIDAEVAAAVEETQPDEELDQVTSTNLSSARDAETEDTAKDLGVEMDIDFDLGIEMEDEFAGIEIDGSDDDDSAMIDVKYSMLDPELRDDLVNDLLELQCFLRQRIREMEQDQGNAYFLLTRNASDVIKSQSLKSLSQYSDVCSTCLTELHGEELQRLLLMRDSKSAMKRLIDTVRSKQNRHEKLENKIKTYQSSVRELEADLGKVRPRLEQTTETTKLLQKMTEEALGEVLKQPQGVRITGSVNAI